MSMDVIYIDAPNRLFCADTNNIEYRKTIMHIYLNIQYVFLMIQYLLWL
jgi:hypothetical protein